MFDIIAVKVSGSLRTLATMLIAMTLVACGGESSDSESSSPSGAQTQQISNASDPQPIQVVDEEPEAEPEEVVSQPNVIVVPEELAEEVPEEVVEEVVEEEEVVEVQNASIELNWEIPLQREDGSDLELYEINGYVIAYGTQSGNLNQLVNIEGAGQTSALIENLAASTYFFAIATIDSDGNQGAYSQEVAQVAL